MFFRNGESHLNRGNVNHKNMFSNFGKEDGETIADRPRSLIMPSDNYIIIICFGPVFNSFA